jgi:hypothetical protein
MLYRNAPVTPFLAHKNPKGKKIRFSERRLLSKGLTKI